MTDQDSTSTRPYLIRALHEWCMDNGFTPYLAVQVDGSVRVPREYVSDGEILLNLSLTATSALLLGNDFIEFTARFAGKPCDIMVPVGRVTSIYARENGQGMAFPPPVDRLPGDVRMAPFLTSVPVAAATEPVAQPDGTAIERVVQLVSREPNAEHASDPDRADDTDSQEPMPPRPPAGGGKKPALKLVK